MVGMRRSGAVDALRLEMDMRCCEMSALPLAIAARGCAKPVWTLERDACAAEMNARGAVIGALGCAKAGLNPEMDA